MGSLSLKKNEAVVYKASPPYSRPDFSAKVVVIGDKASGKTSLVKKYCQSVFKQDYLPTLGSNLDTKEIPVDRDGDKTNVMFYLWDLAGDEHFGWVREKYYQGTRGCMMVIDTTREETLKHVEGWFHEMYHSGVPHVIPTVMLCNKIDLADLRQVHPDEVKMTLDMLYDTNEYKGYRKNPIPVFETSAKDGKNVEPAFTKLATMLLNKMKPVY